MTPTSRRIFAYWLLLLLPTVGVGLAAIYLLRREQARLEERASYADEARRAAVAARARLITENVELLIGDVQDGLLEQLGNEPSASLDRLLDQMEQANPLVRTVFRCDASGRIIRPASGDSDENRAFLRRFGSTLSGTPPWKIETKADEPQLAVTPPSSAPVAVQQAMVPTQEQQLARQEIDYNVSKVQTARREIAAANSLSYAPVVPAEADERRQQFAPVDKTAMSDNTYAESEAPALTSGQAARTEPKYAGKLADKAAPPAVTKKNAPLVSSSYGLLSRKKVSSPSRASDARSDLASTIAETQATASTQEQAPAQLRAASDLSKQQSVPSEPAAANSQAAAPVATAEANERKAESITVQAKTGSEDARANAQAVTGSGREEESQAKEKPIEQAAPAVVALKEILPTPARHGWLPLKLEGRLHLLGWIQPAGLEEVRGVELEMAALIGRFGGAMPGEFSSGEGYALRDDQGRIMEQAGVIPREWASSFSKGEVAVPEPSVRIPLSEKLLPGWEVIAFSPVTNGKIQLGGGFLLVGSLMVGIFLVAIMTGGWLLLRQARQSEAEAVQKTSFVANVSHEFKTPLTTIRLYAELLEQGRVKDATQGADYLRTIGRETERLARLVGNALDFSRLEQGRKKYDKALLDLGATLQRLLEVQRPRFAEAELKLAAALPAETVLVTTDRDALEQIVLNLLDNALKYGAAGGEVTVEVAAVADGAEVRVLDRGPGVPEAHRERIFEKFHRVDDTLTAEKTGTGLGLSIARQLARGLGGELRYAPRAGGGASFILQLP